MRKILISIMLMLAISSYSETLVFMKKVKYNFTMIKVDSLEYGIKTKKKSKMIKKIRYFDVNNNMIQEDEQMYLIDNMNITYIKFPENTSRITLFFDNSFNNTLYFYKK